MRIAGLISKVVAVHGENHPELAQIQTIFAGLSEELRAHMDEERRKYSSPISPKWKKRPVSRRRPPEPMFGTVQNPVAAMIMEHEAAGQALEKCAKSRKVIPCRRTVAPAIMRSTRRCLTLRLTCISTFTSRTTYCFLVQWNSKAASAETLSSLSGMIPQRPVGRSGSSISSDLRELQEKEMKQTSSWGRKTAKPEIAGPDVDAVLRIMDAMEKAWSDKNLPELFSHYWHNDGFVLFTSRGAYLWLDSSKEMLERYFENLDEVSLKFGPRKARVFGDVATVVYEWRTDGRSN